jgi:hypothetical protein
VDIPSNAHATPSHPTTLVAFESTRIKHKRSNVFSMIIETTNNNNKSIIQMMEHMNVTQLEIKKCHNKI